MVGEDRLREGAGEVVRDGWERLAPFPTADNDPHGLLRGERTDDGNDTGSEQTTARIASSEGLIRTLVDDDIPRSMKPVQDPPLATGGDRTGSEVISQNGSLLELSLQRR